jgi:hypothetical protein
MYKLMHLRKVEEVMRPEAMLKKRVMEEKEVP